jgi:ATP-dependent Lon protease
MPRFQRSPAKKSSEDKKGATKKEPTKKRGGFGDRDDDSVDSRGNIRGLINYDYTDDSSEEYTTSDDSSYEAPAKTRKGARKAEPEKKRTGPAAAAGKRTAAKRVVEAETETDTEEEADEPPRKRRKMSAPKPTPARRRKAIVIESETEEEEEEEDDEETEEEYDSDEEEEYDSDEDSDYDEDEPAANEFIIRVDNGMSDGAERMVPQRHNMKKESAEVKKFVELITQPIEENDIDSQIDQFKALKEENRKALLEALENRPTATENSMSLMFKILTMKLPKETQAMVLAKYQSLQNMDPSTGEYFKLRNWLDKLCSVPFGYYKEMPVRLDDGPDNCGTFMARAKKCLDDAVYGQEESKLQIMQFIASKIANPTAQGLSLLLIGPPGIGKTSLIKNGIAKALDWPFQFISLGGDSDASTYSGHQLVYESSHSGKIVNCLCASKSMSTVLLFDELDKISTTAKGEEVQNLLVHLTDSVQNSEFEDKYLAGIPIDLSKVMFVFSANDINKLDRILLDRMVVVKLEGYSAKEKLVIAEKYLLPAALREVNLEEKVGIGKDLIAHIIENYASEEKGVRELKRCLEAVAQKVNMLRMYNDKSLPFYIKDFTLPYVLKKEHVDLFLKKKDNSSEVSKMMMYI